MMCEECQDEGRYQTRYYYEKTNSDFCPIHKWKKRA